MADPIPFLGANKELRPEPEREDYTLPVYTKNNDWVSCWLLDAEEIARVVETGRVWLRVRSRTHPYVKVGVEEPLINEE